MIDVKITAAASDGTPLGTLGRIIEQKAALMGKTWQNVAIGAMIQTVRSIRAATREAKASRKAKPQISAAASGLVAAWKREGGRNVRTLRSARGVRDESLMSRYRVRFICRKESRTARPFLVVPEHESVKPYIVVAESAAEARAYEQRKAARRNERMGGFARTALGYAMARLSTRNSGGLRNFRTRTPLSSLVAAGVRRNGRDGAEIFVYDLLDYAAAAVKGGRAAVDSALMKTCNKVTGEMRRWISERGSGFFTSRGLTAPNLSIPYPEVSSRRAS